MMAHARLSPSAAARWATCTASVKAIERARAAGTIGPDESSPWADEGTAAHTVREECLSLGLDPFTYVGTSVLVNGKRWEVTQEMAEALAPGIDWIMERADPDRLLVEHRLAMDPWLPGQFGTLDCGFWWQPDGAEGPVEVVLSDLKYGFIPVDAEDNIQQKIYALSYTEYADTYGIADRIRIVIDQPRNGGLKEWTISRDDLLNFGEWISDRGQEALSDDGVFAPSPKACQWCPLAAPGLCEARDRWVLEDLLSIEDLDDLDQPPALPGAWEITPERRAQLRKHAGVIRAWLEGLDKAAFADAMRGEPDPGFKLVLGDEGDRKWADPKAAEALLAAVLGDAAYAPQAVISPPQAEKLLKPGRKKPGNPEAWATLLGHIKRAPARPMLVPDTNEKPEYRPTEVMAAELDDLDF